MGVTEEGIKHCKIHDIRELEKIKLIFRTKYDSLMTNILRLALRKEEQSLACIITAYYNMKLTEEMLSIGLDKA